MNITVSSVLASDDTSFIIETFKRSRCAVTTIKVL